MATVEHVAPNRWVVHLGSKENSEVTIEVHMSHQAAEKIAALETERIAKLNPDRPDLPPETPGMAILEVLGLYLAHGHMPSR